MVDKMVDKLVELIKLLEELDELQYGISRKFLYYNSFPEPIIRIPIGNYTLTCWKRACVVEVSNKEIIVSANGEIDVLVRGARAKRLSAPSADDVNTLTEILRRHSKEIDSTVETLRNRIEELREYLAELTLLS